MMNKIDPKKLKGIALFDYYTTDHPDDETRQLAFMLPGALGGMDKAIKVFERMASSGKLLRAYYPPKGTPPESSRVVGTIPDGVVYLD